MITKRLIVIWIIISLIQPSLRFATTEPARAANVVYKSGHITHSEVWTADNLYVIQDNLTIDQGVSLTIQPGTWSEICPCSTPLRPWSFLTI